METLYLRTEEEVLRRRRQLNALGGAQRGLALSLGAVIVGGIAGAMGTGGGLDGGTWLLLLTGGAALGTGLGALWGLRRSIALAQDLYRVDRALRLEERLVTVYELRRDAGPEARALLRPLYRQLDDQRGRLRPENIRRALSLSPEERRAWWGTGALGLLALILPLAPMMDGAQRLSGGTVPPPFEGRLASPPEVEVGSDPMTAVQRPGAESPPSGSAEGDPCLQERSVPAATLTEEQQEDLCLREEAPAEEGSVPSPTSPSALPSSALEALDRTLRRLLESLVGSEMSADRVRSEVQSLMEALPPGELRETLERAAQAAAAQELRERLEEAIAQLSDRLASARADATAGDGDPSSSPSSSNGTTPRGESSSSPSAGVPSESGTSEEGEPGSADTSTGSGGEPSEPSGADAETGGSSESSASGAQAQVEAEAEEAPPSSNPGGGSNDPSESAGGEGQNAESQGAASGAEAGVEAETEASSGSVDSAQEGEGGSSTGTAETSATPSGTQGTPSESGSEAGGQNRDRNPSGPGSGSSAGSDATESPPDRWTGLEEGLLIQGGELPRDAQLLSRLLTQGLPVDLAGPGEDGTPVVVLNVARFESLLEARNLPPELRALVRAYFLAIAEGSSPSNTPPEKGKEP